MLAAVSAALGWSAPAEAQQAEINRDWTSTLLFGARDDLNLKSAGVGLGESAFVWTAREDKTLRAAFRSRGGGLGPVQVLDQGQVETLALAGSFRGGAIAVWCVANTQCEMRMATLAPGARRFSAPQTLSTTGYANPAVAMNERGDALIAYTSSEGTAVHHRPAGGQVGSAELISTESIWPPSLAVAPDGSAIAGFQDRDRLVVRISPPGGKFGPRHLLGRPQPELSPGSYLNTSIAVGVDAAGNAVAAWVDDASWTPPGESRPGRAVMAFKPHDAAPFGAPRDTGVTAFGVPAASLAVTGPGEVLLGMTAASRHANGVSYTDGAIVLFADARRGRIGTPVMLTPEDQMSDVRVGVNERGDAVLTYPITQTSPGHTIAWRMMFRRRAPHGSFGPALEHRPRTVAWPWRSRAAERPLVDAHGNAQAVWWDGLSDEGGTPPYDVLIAEDGPLLTQPPPPVAPSDGELPPVLAPESEPPTADVPAPPALARDRKAPVVRLRVERRISRGRVRARVRCSERCALRIKGRVGRRTLRAVAATAAARKERTLRLRAPRRGVLRLDLRARDAAGNERRVKRTVRLRADR